MKKPLVSVIIPCYNVEDYLSICLDSVLNSTLKDIEIIAINDGSTDKTLDILKEYALKDTRLKVYDQDNVGQAKTRNKAIKKASSDYLFFLDSDDYIDSDLLEKLYAKVLVGSDIVISAAKRVEEDKITNMETLKQYSNDDIINYILNSSGPCWKLIKKDIIVNNNLYFYENHIYEDIAVTPAWGLYADKISYVEDVKYYYLIHSNSTMNQEVYSSKLEDIFYSLDYLTINLNGRYQEELEYIYIKHLLHAASLRFFKFNKYDMLNKIVDIIKGRYPKWQKNIYYKKESIKYKIVCTLFYKRKYRLLKLLLKK